MQFRYEFVSFKYCYTLLVFTNKYSLLDTHAPHSEVKERMEKLDMEVDADLVRTKKWGRNENQKIFYMDEKISFLYAVIRWNIFVQLAVIQEMVCW